MNMVVIQIIGFIGTALQIFSFQCRANRNLFIMQLGSCVFYIIQFWLLGAYSGCISIALVALRNLLLSLNRPWSNWRGWPPIITAALFGAALLTYQDIFSLFPAIAASGLTWADWTRNPRTIRLGGLCCNSPFWCIYDWHVSSWSGVVCEVFCMSSVIISIIRFGWKALDQKQV